MSRVVALVLGAGLMISLTACNAAHSANPSGSTPSSVVSSSTVAAPATTAPAPAATTAAAAGAVQDSSAINAISSDLAGISAGTNQASQDLGAGDSDRNQNDGP